MSLRSLLWPSAPGSPALERARRLLVAVALGIALLLSPSVAQAETVSPSPSPTATASQSATDEDELDPSDFTDVALDSTRTVLVFAAAGLLALLAGAVVFLRR